MNIEKARENLMYKMEQLEAMANNYYNEDGQELVDRIECDLDDLEYQIQQCKEALADYEYALDNEESEEDENE